MLLTLPTISPDVPLVCGESPVLRGHLQMVRHLAANGYLDHALPEISLDNLAKSLLPLIESFWTTEFGSLFDFKVLRVAPILWFDDSSVAETRYYDPLPAVRLAFDAPSDPAWIIAEPSITALENVAPGLGAFSMRVLTQALWCFGFAFTPVGCWDVAVNHFWFGCEKYEDALEEARANYGENVSIEELDVPTEAELFRGVPGWAYRQPEKPLKRSSVKRHLKRLGPDHPCAELLARVVRIDELLDKGDWLPACTGDSGRFSCTPPAVLMWSQDDDLGRMFDVVGEAAMQGDACDHVSHIGFKSDFAGFAETLDSIRHTAVMMHELDDALDLMERWVPTEESS